MSFGDLVDFGAVSLPAAGALLVLIAYCHHTQETTGRILNVVTLPGAAAAALATPLYAEDPGAHLASGAVVLVILVALALWQPAGLGMGAVKLLVVVAIVLGPVCWPAIVISLAGATAESFGRTRTGSRPVSPVPYLAAGVVAVAVLAIAS